MRGDCNKRLLEEEEAKIEKTTKNIKAGGDSIQTEKNTERTRRKGPRKIYKIWQV